MYEGVVFVSLHSHMYCIMLTTKVQRKKLSQVFVIGLKPVNKNFFFVSSSVKPRSFNLVQKKRSKIALVSGHE
jgi:hypothetical protein